MLFRLSLAWGIPVTEIEHTVAFRELQQWCQYWTQEPWGTWRDNAHAGLIAATVANSFRGEKRQPFTMEDFFLLDSQANEQRRAERAQRGQQVFIGMMRALAKEN